MKVTVRSTPQRLVLRLVPVKIAAYWIFGVAFIALAWWTMSAMGHATAFTCRQEGRGCRLSQRSLFGGSSSELAAAQLLRARVDTTLGFVAGMQLVVVTDGGDVPLRLVAANGPAKDSLAGVINDFIAEPAHAGFEIRDDARIAAWLLGIVLLGAGAVCILAIERTFVSFDRDANLVRLRRRRWFGRRELEMRLDQLERVSTAPFTVGEATSYSVILEFAGAHGEVPLTAMPMFTDASAERARKAIEGWLHPV